MRLTSSLWHKEVYARVTAADQLVSPVLYDGILKANDTVEFFAATDVQLAASIHDALAQLIVLYPSYQPTLNAFDTLAPVLWIVLRSLAVILLTVASHCRSEYRLGAAHLARVP